MLIWRLALRSLVRNPRRTALTLGAVLLGTGVVVFGHGFGEGLVQMLVQNAVEKRAGAVQLHRIGYLDASEAAPLTLDVDAALAERVATVKGVKAAAPRIRFTAVLSTGKLSSMVIAEGLDVVREPAVCPGRASEIPAENGRPLDVKSPNGLVLTRELADALGVKLGSSLTLQASGREGQMNALDVEITGITAGAGMLETKRLVSVPLTLAQELLGMDGRATEIAIAAHDLSDLDVLMREVRSAVPSDIQVSTWSDVNPFLKDAVARLTIILNGISFVLFTIVVFGVVNAMLMSVYERVREIGTMMAVGVRRRQVLLLFLAEASAIGLFGALSGAALGLALTALVGHFGISFSPPGALFEQLIRPVPRVDVALAAVVGAVIGALLAALYPARRASAMNPVDALRQ
jgi:putative ABC transport system permease protein